MVPCRDFDFEFGALTVEHRRLKDLLAGCTEWEEFRGACTARPVLGGNGNLEENEIHFPSGSYRASALRAVDPAKGTWAIWWLDERNPNHPDPPVIGSFHNRVGEFVAQDRFNDKPILVRFIRRDTETI
jgi:hypothetical protein